MQSRIVSSDRVYRFILPPGWVRIDLRVPLAGQVQALVDVLVAQAPAGPRRAEIRMAAMNQLTRVCQDARDNGVLDLVLPATMIEGAPLSASWAFLPMETPEANDPVELLAAIASQDASATLVDLQGLVALRISSRAQRSGDLLQEVVHQVASDLGETVSEVPEQEQAVVWTERVQYFIGDPRRPENWIIVVFSATDAGDDESAALTAALVELFDEVMLTVRFPDE